MPAPSKDVPAAVTIPRDAHQPRLSAETHVIAGVTRCNSGDEHSAEAHGCVARVCTDAFRRYDG
jgi:hypothetical protein